MSKNVPGPPAAFSSRALSDAIITNNKRETNWKTCTSRRGHIGDEKRRRRCVFSATSVTTPTHREGGNARTKTFEVFGEDISSQTQYPDVPRERTHWGDEQTVGRVGGGVSARRWKMFRRRRHRRRRRHLLLLLVFLSCSVSIANGNQEITRR